MSILNIPTCESNAGNTGVPSCYFDLGKIKGIFLTKKSTYLSAANLASETALLTAMQTAVMATGDARLYPMFRFQAINDQSEEAVTSTSGYGEVQFSREGMYNWTFELADGGMCLQKNLRKFNGQSGYSVYLVDDKNQLIGKKDSSGNLWGFDIGFFYAHKLQINNGSDASKYMVQFTMPRVGQLNDQFGVVAATTIDFESDVLGILDLELYQVAVAAGVATIGVRLNCGKTNLYADLKTALAAPALWTATNPSTGATVTITGVTADDTNLAFDVAMTHTGAITIGLASPATLDAASIGGAPLNPYEGIPVTVTLPAP